MTISVPDALKRRMDKVKGEANWSQVASSAFDKTLAEIAKRKEVKTMNEVVERLKASKRESIEVVSEEGRIAGVEWAKQYAETPELERLEIEEDNFTDLGAEWASPQSAALWFQFHVRGKAAGEERPDDVQLALDFWNEAAGLEKLPDAEYVSGFTVGAMEVWQEVKSEL